MAVIVGSAASNVSKSSRSDSTQVTFPAIAGAASGDTAYLFHAADGSGSASVPSGWTEIDLDNGTSTDWMVASRVITGDSDYTSLDAGFDPGQGWTSIIVIVSGTHTLEAFANDNDGDATAYVPQITGFNSGDLSVIHGTADDQQVSMTPPTGWTLFANDDGTDGSNLSSAGLAYKVSAGGTEGQTTPGSGDEWSGPSDDGTASFHIRFSGIDDPDAAGGTTYSGVVAVSGAGTVSASALRTRSASTALSGSGTVSVSATRTRPASTSLNGTGTLSANGTTTVTVSGSVSLSAAGSLSAVTTRTRSASVSLSGAGTTSASTTRTRAASTALSGSGSLSASASVVTPSISGSVSLTASGTLSSSATRTRPASVSVTGIGSVNVVATRVASASVSLTGTGTLYAILSSGQFSSISLTGSGTLSASGHRIRSATNIFVDVGVERGTQSGDTRVLENGTDIRIIDGEFQPWTGVSEISVNETFTEFSPTANVKQGGVWKEMIPYVKYEGNWVQPRYIYTKVSGVWTRTY